MSAGGRRFSVQVPDWGQDHLSAEAVAAYVDGELGDRPYDRATRHLAECAECAAQVVAQGQARAALRSARCPSLPLSLMTTLRSIPQAADLPPAPNGLAMTSDGRLVALAEPAPALSRPSPSRSAPAAPPAGLAEPLAPNKGRFGRLSAGAAMSGLVLGALAIGAAIIAGDAASSPAAGPATVEANLHSAPGAP